MGLLILIGTLVLLVTLPGLASTSNTTVKPKKILTKIKQDAKTVKKSMVKGFKGVKTEVKKDAKAVKQSTVKGFKGAKTQVKKDAHTVLKDIVNWFKSLKFN